MDSFCRKSDNEINANQNTFNNFKYDKQKYILINNKNREDTLFCKDNILKIIKELFSNNFEYPLLINGLKGIGKKHTILNLLHYIPSIKNKIKLNLLKPLKNENFENILYYKNFYLINFKIYSEVISSKLVKYFGELVSSKVFINEKRVFLIANIQVLSNENQRILSNLIEIYYQDNFFILTHNRTIKNKKLLSLSIQIKYSCVDIITFKDRLLKFFKNKDKKIPFYDEVYRNINKYEKHLYEVYKNNNYNIGYTLYHINQMIIEDKIIPKEIKKKTNKTSIYDKIATKTINKILLYKKKPKDTISNIRLDLYNYISLNIDEEEFVQKIITILLNVKIQDNLKFKIIKLGEEFSRYNIEPDKKIICLENFIINLIDIFN